MSRRRLALLAAAVVVGLAACGTTVPRSQRLQAAAGAGSAASDGSGASAAGGGLGDGAGLGPSSAGPLSAGQQAAGQQAAGLQAVTDQAAGSALLGPAAAGAGPAAPLLIGILVQAESSAGINSAAGISTTATTAWATFQQPFLDLVKVINANGGLDGHPLRTTVFQFNPDDADYATELQAACAQFTQDNHVAVVISADGFFADSFESCLNAAGVPDVTASQESITAAEEATWPGFSAPVALGSDQLETAVLTSLTANRWITPTSRIGVVYTNCPWDVDAYDNTVTPLVHQLHLDVVSDFSVDCADGYGSIASSAAALQAAVLRFKAAGVNLVLPISHQEAAGILLFAEAADAQDYDPRYAMSSAGEAAQQAVNLPKAVLANMEGAGWNPIWDTLATDVTAPTAKQCLAEFATAGDHPTAGLDVLQAYWACDTFGFYRAAIVAQGGVPTAARMPADREAIGDTLALAETIDNGADLARGRSGGAPRTAVFAYQAPCACFAYVTPPEAAPT